MLRILTKLAAVTLLLAGASGLRLTSFSVPSFLLLGSPTWLNCSLDLESDELYSVKWYKGEMEFYRYLPRDNPHGQKYDLPGVYLDLSRSLVGSVYLRKTDLASEGIYKCEASAESPTFQTVNAEKSLQVFALPSVNPSITGGKVRYTVGDRVNVTCRSGPSKPEAKLDWYINGKEASPGFLRPYPVNEYQPGLWTSAVGLSFIVQPAHVAEGDLELRCTSTVILSYWDDSKEMVISDLPQTEQQDTEATWIVSEDAPVVTGGRDGDNLDFNCSIPDNSEETVDVTWFVNEKKVPRAHLVRYASKKTLGLRMRFGPHYQDMNGEMRMRCRSTKHRLLSLRSSEVTMTAGNHRNSGLVVAEEDAAAKVSERSSSSGSTSNSGGDVPSIPDWALVYLSQIFFVLL